MKKIIKPAQKEKAEYFSDFSNTSFDCFEPEAQI